MKISDSCYVCGGLVILIGKLGREKILFPYELQHLKFPNTILLHECLKCNEIWMTGDDCERLEDMIQSLYVNQN